MYCRQCGEHLLEEESSCLNCGTPVSLTQPLALFSGHTGPARRVEPLNHATEDFTTHVTARPKKKRNPQNYIIAAAIVVIAILSAAVVALLTTRPDRETAAAKQPDAVSAPSATPKAHSPNINWHNPTFTPTPLPTPHRPSSLKVPVDSSNSYNYNTAAPIYFPPSRPAGPKPPSQDVVAHPMIIGPGAYRYIQFSVAALPYQAYLVGWYNAHVGSNDINTVVIAANEHPCFQNHGNCRYFYNKGYINSDRVKLPLPPGEYFLIFNNRRALFTGKKVEAYFELRYE